MRGRSGSKRLESGPHRDLPGGTAEHRLAQPQAGGGGVEPRDIVAVDHRLDHADLRMVGEQAQRVTDDGRATQGAILLGQIAPDAGSAPGRDHHHRHFALHRATVLPTIGRVI